MTERAAARLIEKYEAEDRGHLESAALQLDHTGLRYMLRQLLEIGGMAQNPFNKDPLTMAFNTGKMAAVQEFFDLLHQFQPDLAARLTMESQNEYHTRNALVAARFSDTGE
jgi:hypothetical protein